MEIIEAESVPVASSFRASSWSTPVLVAGLGFLLFYCLVYLFGQESVRQLPFWFQLIIAFTLPHFYFILYPLLTRKQTELNRFKLPSFKKVVVEGLLAIPLIFLCFLITGLTQFVITAFVPEPVVTPDVANIIQRSDGTMTMYLLLFAMALYGPIAEELFFRGFLFNAFRDRMPLMAAVLIQSVLFAVLHCYSVEYTIIVFPTALVLTLVYLWRATILTPMFIHIGYNSLAAIGLLITMHAAANQSVLGVSPQLESTECVVAIVYPGSPADAAGILAGDTIIQFDKYAIEDFQDLLNATTYSQPGDKVVVVLMRDGEQVVVEATLVSRKTLRSNLNQAPQP